jgi:hypothetical protein
MSTAVAVYTLTADSAGRSIAKSERNQTTAIETRRHREHRENENILSKTKGMVFVLNLISLCFFMS